MAAYLITKLDFSVTLLGIVYRPWRLLTLVMALPLGVGALMLHFFSESPKFLINVGRNGEAIDVLKKMYVVNNKNTEKEFSVRIFLVHPARRAAFSHAIASIAYFMYSYSLCYSHNMLSYTSYFLKIQGFRNHLFLDNILN